MTKKLVSLAYAYHTEAFGRRILKHELKERRKHTLEEEEQTVAKRLKKQDSTRSWSLQELCRARGYEKEAIEAIVNTLPNRDTTYEA